MRDNWSHHHRYRRNRGGGDKTAFGIIVLMIGVFLLLRTLHIIPFLSLHHFWPLILIVVGVAIGIKHKFMNSGPWILIFIGVANMIPEFTFMGQSSERLVWPLVLIGAGTFIMLRSRKKKYLVAQVNTVPNNESLLNVDVTFGGRKEIVTSKDFKGGTISTTFAGAEINLMQADSLTQPIVLDIKVTFGGVELIVPSHWEIQNDIAPSFGSVEDHRIVRTPNSGEDKKILSLRGSCAFGSIEIKSY